jgi:hypothetical protein
MNRVRVGRVGAVVLVAALAACGGSSKPKSDTTTTKAAAPNPDKDRVAASALVLRQTDFPSGWTASTHEDDPSDARLQKELAACAGASDPTTQTAQFDGPDVDNGGAEVSTSANFAASDAAYQKDIAALKSAKYQSCIKTLLGTELQDQLTKSSPGVTISGINIDTVDTPTYGDVTVKLSVSMTLTGPDDTIKLYIDDISYGKDRAEVDLTFSNTGAPFDETLEKSLTAKAVAKLKTLS